MAKPQFIQAALMQLYPNSEYAFNGTSLEDGLVWRNSNTQPDYILIDTTASLLEALASRVEAYPSVENQLDILWHDIDAGIIPGKDTSVWYTTVKQVKDQFPKP